MCLSFFLLEPEDALSHEPHIGRHPRAPPYVRDASELPDSGSDGQVCGAAAQAAFSTQEEQPQQQGKEGAPGRAPRAERTASIGTTSPHPLAMPCARSFSLLLTKRNTRSRGSCAAVAEPKEPKRASVRLGDRGEADANMHEILFWSFLLVQSHAGAYGKLDKWSRDAYAEHGAAEMLMAEWKPPASFGMYKNVSGIFKPMKDAAGFYHSRATMKQHEERECLLRPVECKFGCKTVGLQGWRLPRHYETCAKRTHTWVTWRRGDAPVCASRSWT